MPAALAADYIRFNPFAFVREHRWLSVTCVYVLIGRHVFQLLAASVALVIGREVRIAIHRYAVDFWLALDTEQAAESIDVSQFCCYPGHCDLLSI